jgi:hypothetical protein
LGIRQHQILPNAGFRAVNAWPRRVFAILIAVIKRRCCEVERKVIGVVEIG